jgi:hypothetical protein
MIVTLTKKDILYIYNNILLKYVTKEIGFIITNHEIKIFKGKKDHINNIPINIGIIGHTHPINAYKDLDNAYNPPSKIDIESSIKNYKMDFIIFDKKGMWVYRPNKFLITLIKDKKLIKSILYISDIKAIELITNQISLSQYCNFMKKIYYDLSEKKYIGFNLKFISYKDCSQIKLVFNI